MDDRTPHAHPDAWYDALHAAVSVAVLRVEMFNAELGHTGQYFGVEDSILDDLIVEIDGITPRVPASYQREAWDAFWRLVDDAAARTDGAAA